MGKSTSAVERFWPKVKKTESCWNWAGAVGAKGYGAFWHEGNSRPAHRWLLEYLRGPIDPEAHVDHLCRNTLCVRPDHLEVVSERTNILRGYGPPAMNARKTHCVRGHEFTPANTIIRTADRRNCRTCTNARKRKPSAFDLLGT